MVHFQSIDQATFLKEYWQKKPLLIRQALPDFVEHLSASETPTKVRSEKNKSSFFIWLKLITKIKGYFCKMNSPQAKHNIENCDPKTHIIIKGARVHNLKGVDVAIPRNKLVVITGLSGSGKSS